MSTSKSLMAQNIKIAEEELRQFNDWFIAKGNAPLASFERAILKTYVVARLLGEFPSALASSQTSSGEE
jgi:hypothetical protein